MTEGGMLYLILICAGFLSLLGTLFWGMMRTSPPTIGTHAQTEKRGEFAPAHQNG